MFDVLDVVHTDLVKFVIYVLTMHWQSSTIGGTRA